MFQTLTYFQHSRKTRTCLLTGYWLLVNEPFGTITPRRYEHIVVLYVLVVGIRSLLFVPAEHVMFLWLGDSQYSHKEADGTVEQYDWA